MDRFSASSSPLAAANTDAASFVDGGCSRGLLHRLFLSPDCDGGGGHGQPGLGLRAAPGWRGSDGDGDGAWDVGIRGAEATIRGRPRPHLRQQAWAPQLYLAAVLTLRFTPPPPPSSRSSSTWCLGRSYLPAFVWFPRPRSALGSTSPLSQVPDPFIAPSPMLSVKFPWTN